MNDCITIRHELSCFSVTEEPELVTSKTRFSIPLRPEEEERIILKLLINLKCSSDVFHIATSNRDFT